MKRRLPWVGGQGGVLKSWIVYTLRAWHKVCQSPITSAVLRFVFRPPNSTRDLGYPEPFNELTFPWKTQTTGDHYWVSWHFSSSHEKKWKFVISKAALPSRKDGNNVWILNLRKDTMLWKGRWERRERICCTSLDWRTSIVPWSLIIKWGTRENWKIANSYSVALAAFKVIWSKRVVGLSLAWKSTPLEKRCSV